MARTLLDDHLRTWEVYATSGRSGFADRARLVFLCLTEPRRRALAAERDGDRAAVERWLEEATSEALADAMADAEELR